MAPWARGRGVAERAGRAVAHWAFEVLGLRRLIWRAEVGNHASQLVAERIGFTFDGVVRALPARAKDGGFVDGWHGSLLPGEVCDTPPPWVAPGGPGALRGPHVRPPARPPRRAGPGELRLRPRTSDLDDLVATLPRPGHRPVDVVPLDYAPGTGAWTSSATGIRTGWLRGTGVGFVLADSDDRFAGTIDLRFNPVDPVQRRARLLLGTVDPGQGVHDRGGAGDLRLRASTGSGWAGSSGGRTWATSRRAGWRRRRAS